MIDPRTFTPPTRAAADYYYLSSPNGNDDGIITSWLADINNCSITNVVGVIPAGTFVVHSLYELAISNCGDSNRTVEIYGAGRDNTIIDIQSQRSCDHDGVWGDGLGFVVYTERVTIHDLALRGHQGVDGYGNCGQGIKFVGAGAGFGTVHDVKTSSFGNAGIDVYQAPGVYIHDNFVDCNGSDGTGPTSSETSMGIWVREIQTPPPPGVTNGSVNGNVFFGCKNEAIMIANAQHVVAYYNTIHCGDVGGYTGTCSIGIGLTSDGSSCTSRPVVDDAVGYNTVYAHHQLKVGILIDAPHGLGSGSNNLIEHNTITGVSGAETHGIQVAHKACNGGDGTAFTGTTISDNSISGLDSGATTIWVGGNYSNVTNNYCSGGYGVTDVGTLGSYYQGNGPCSSPVSGASISGPNVVSSGTSQTWNAVVIYAPGPYTYQWSGIAFGSSSNLTATLYASGTLYLDVWDAVGHHFSTSQYIAVSGGNCGGYEC